MSVLCRLLCTFSLAFFNANLLFPGALCGLSSTEETDDHQGETVTIEPVNMVEEEEIQRGTIKGTVLLAYLKGFGSAPFTVTLFIMACLRPGTVVATNYWLSLWTSDELHASTL